jgi:hypothetical protein
MATADKDPRIAPSTMDPSKFTFIEAFYQGNSDEMQDAYRVEHRELDRLLGDDWAEKYCTPQCSSCGTRYMHGWLVRHQDGTIFSIGHTCAEEYFSLPSKAAVKQRKAQKARETRERREAGEQFLVDALGEAFSDFEAWREDTPFFARYFVEILEDMTRSAKRYGSLTDRQVEFATKLHREAIEKMERKAERDATATVKLPVPDSGEIQTIVGTVVSTKYVPDRYSYYGGDIFKMLVEDERGFRVFGTVPSRITNVNTEDGRQRTLGKGDRVSFRAHTERSKDDTYFGFYKAPKVAKVLEIAREEN